MELSEAKEIVKQMYPGSFLKTVELPNSSLHSPAIALVCSAALAGDLEAIEIQKCIPMEMGFMGLYPNIIKKLDMNLPDMENMDISIFNKIYNRRKIFKDKK
jgi:hypothetical protein